MIKVFLPHTYADKILRRIVRSQEVFIISASLLVVCSVSSQLPKDPPSVQQKELASIRSFGVSLKMVLKRFWRDAVQDHLPR